MSGLGEALEGLFKILMFLAFVAPFLCIGFGILIGYWIWA